MVSLLSTERGGLAAHRVVVVAGGPSMRFTLPPPTAGYQRRAVNVPPSGDGRDELPDPLDPACHHVAGAEAPVRPGRRREPRRRARRDRSPGRSRRWRPRYARISGIENRMSAVVPSWIGSPLTRHSRRRSADVELVRRHDPTGPTGQNPGMDLPMSHWSPSSHSSRDDTSFIDRVAEDAAAVPDDHPELDLGVDVVGDGSIPGERRSVGRDRRGRLAVHERSRRARVRRLPRRPVVQADRVDRAGIRHRGPERRARQRSPGSGRTGAGEGRDEIEPDRRRPPRSPGPSRARAT